VALSRVLARLFPSASNKAGPLRGAPEVRRVKTHQAESGYVFQYYFDGWRESGGGREYVFAYTLDRENYSAVSVWVEECPLKDSERHAAAKLTLFRLFDEAEPPAPVPAGRLSAEQAREILRRLGRLL
jgi:hypothetical protein